jgi:hypothetical protein
VDFLAGVCSIIVDGNFIIACEFAGFAARAKNRFVESKAHPKYGLLS